MSETFTIVASVGTYHHPFDRFAQWMEQWTRTNQASVVFQHGSTRPMRGSENHEVLTPKELLEHYRAADAIVLQGGAGGVMDARKVGRIPIVVPRIPVGREVVDDHQVVLCRRLAELGVVHLAESADELARLLEGVRAGTVSSRLSSHQATPGVREAVRTLTANHLEKRLRPEQGKVLLAPPRLNRRRITLRRSLSRLLHSHLFGYVLAFAVALGVVERVDLSAAFRTATLGLVGLWLLGSFILLPAYDRARSIRPLVWFAALLGVGLMFALVAGLHSSVQLQRSLAVAVCSAATFGLASSVHRLLFRRTPTVLVGDESALRRLAVRWSDRRDVKVVGSCAWRGDKHTAIPNASLAELVPQVMGVAARNHARSVVVASERSLAPSTLRDLAGALHRAGVECVVLTEGSEHAERVRLRRFAGELALPTRPPADHLLTTAIKAAIDEIAAVVGLLALSPLLVAVGIAVRLTSRHPAILRQARTGRDGVTFVMYTFRTVVVEPGRDVRLSSLGRLLRRTSIDELPRLVNVLKGDMSIVGPRPSPPSETVRYSDLMWRRLSVKPGVTGLSQVSGRSSLSPEEAVRIDLRYIDHWSLRLDARILARTLRVALTRDATR